MTEAIKFNLSNLIVPGLTYKVPRTVSFYSLNGVNFRNDPSAILVACHRASSLAVFGLPTHRQSSAQPQELSIVGH